jgi:hypothetical protein
LVVVVMAEEAMVKVRRQHQLLVEQILAVEVAEEQLIVVVMLPQEVLE